MKVVTKHDPEKIEAFHRELRQHLEQVRTHKDLELFSDMLSRGAEMGAFGHTDLGNYFEGMSLVLDGLDGLCKNNKLPFPTQPTWQWMARILLYATHQA